MGHHKTSQFFLVVYESFMYGSSLGLHYLQLSLLTNHFIANAMFHHMLYQPDSCSASRVRIETTFIYYSVLARSLRLINKISNQLQISVLESRDLYWLSKCFPKLDTRARRGCGTEDPGDSGFKIPRTHTLWQQCCC